MKISRLLPFLCICLIQLSVFGQVGSVAKDASYIEVDAFDDFDFGFAEVQIGNRKGLINNKEELVFDH